MTQNHPLDFLKTLKIFTWGREFSVILIISVIIAGGLFYFQNRSEIDFSTGEAAVNKPNIVFILVDDLDARLLPYLPRVKSLLADQGTTFSNYFMPDAQCCPSRTSILRGQYAHNTGVHINYPPNGGAKTFFDNNLDSSTVGTWLKSAGYKTMYAGKFLNGYGEDTPSRRVPPGWDSWHVGIGREIYDGFNYRLNENGTIVKYATASKDFLTDVIARKAVNFINHNSGKSPMFVFLSPTNPHNPTPIAPRHRRLKLPDAELPLTAAFNEVDVTDKPEWIQEIKPLTTKEREEMNLLFKRRIRSMMAVEDMLAGVINALNAKGQLDNTYIFFATDNGFHMGEHRLTASKATFYEEAIRAPMIVRGPGIPAGRISDHFIINHDLPLTFADIAGTQAPAFADGTSFKGLLALDDVASWRKAVLLERWPDKKEEHPSTVVKGIRTAEYTYAEYDTGERELYDLIHDPYQLNNLYSVARSSNAAALSGLSSELSRLENCQADLCRSAEGF